MNLIERVKNILITPKTEWEVINSETATPPGLLTSYILPLAIVSAIGPLINGFLFSQVLGTTYVLVQAVISLVIGIGVYFGMVYIVDALAPSFASEKNQGKSAQLIAYSNTPSYIAGLLSFIPVLGWILPFLAWGYSIYLMYLGIGPLKKTPEDKKIVYVIVIIIILIAISMILGAIFAAVLLRGLISAAYTM